MSDRILTINGAPVESRVKTLWWQDRGLSYTRTGYGRRIPTAYQVRLSGRWRRVYCCCYSNSGTCYVDGPKVDGKRGPWIVVNG